jgi:hypothetical protein
VSELSAALQDAVQRQALRAEAAARAASGTGTSTATEAAPGAAPVSIVLITGFESFNVDLYKQVAARIKQVAPHIKLKVSNH